jgi:hypothetical protein
VSFSFDYSPPSLVDILILSVGIRAKYFAFDAVSKCSTYTSSRRRRHHLSVRKVVPTLISKSAEIYLLMAGAKQLGDTDLSLFRPRPYVQQWCARGTVLRCTVVLVEGGYKRGGRGGRASRSQRSFD